MSRFPNELHHVVAIGISNRIKEIEIVLANDLELVYLFVSSNRSTCTASLFYIEAQEKLQKLPAHDSEITFFRLAYSPSVVFRFT